MNDYYLGTPTPIPKLARVIAWTLAALNLTIAVWLGGRRILAWTIGADGSGHRCSRWFGCWPALTDGPYGLTTACTRRRARSSRERGCSSERCAPVAGDACVGQTKGIIGGRARFEIERET
jgi:hypothetical protein